MLRCAFDLNKLASIVTSFSYTPSTCNIVNDLLSSFCNLYLDEDNILYSLPNCFVFEIRGMWSIIFLSDVEENQLLVTVSSIARSGSYLDVMYIKYYIFSTN